MQAEGREECIEVLAEAATRVDMWNYFIFLEMEADVLLNYFLWVFFFIRPNIGRHLEAEFGIDSFAGLPVEEGKNALYAPNNIEPPGVTMAPRVDRCFGADRFNLIVL